MHGREIGEREKARTSAGKSATSLNAVCIIFSDCAAESTANEAVAVSEPRVHHPRIRASH
jgi:hypothetical protein